MLHTYPRRQLLSYQSLGKIKKKKNCEEEGVGKNIFISIYSEAKTFSICKLLKSILFKGFILTEDLVPGT